MSASRFLLDENIGSHRLVALLRQTGFDVVTVHDVGMREADDPTVLQCAAKSNRILITLNAKHFKALHDQRVEHSGIVAIYQDNDPRDMGAVEIMDALRNLLASGIPIAGEFIDLNHWRVPRSR